MAQRFDDLLSPRKRKRGSSKSATLLLSLDTPAAIILLHPVKVVPKVWYLVGINRSPFYIPKRQQFSSVP